MRSLLLLIAFRLVGVFLVRSWFVPDEVFQSVEVAHHAVYGTGHLSWEWDTALRSFLHPFLISCLLFILKFFGIDTQNVVAFAPRIMHAFLFAISDWFYIRLTRRLIATSDGARYSVLMYLSSWFVWYCSPRTLANSVETALTIIALNWYPFEHKYKERKYVWPYMTIGMLTIIMRPTAALIWLIFGGAHLLKSSSPIRLLFFTCVPAMVPVLIFGVVIDSLYYEKFTFSMWNFLQFNVLAGGSAVFGIHPWYWYLSEGLTSVLTVQLVPIILGLFSHSRPNLLPFWASVFYLIFHSFLPHKEQRFLLPLVPLLCLYAGPFLAGRPKCNCMKRVLTGTILVINIIIMLYVGLRHQIGPYSAADFILKDSQYPAKVVVLMPCYSLPGISYFHTSASFIRSLDCSPDLMKTGRPEEADVFHDDPHAWIGLHKNEIKRMSHIVLYDKYYKFLELTLLEYGFKMCARLFHADFLTSSRADYFIVVACSINN